MPLIKKINKNAQQAFVVQNQEIKATEPTIATKPLKFNIIDYQIY